MTEEEKGIAQRIKELSREISHHYEDAEMHTSLAALKVKQRMELQSKLDACTAITVTPEAIVDYMAIYHSNMLIGVRRRILREGCLRGVQFSGNGKYATDDGKAVMTVADNTILGFSEISPAGKETDKE